MAIATNAEIRGDPTQTQALRQAYGARLRRWFDKLIAALEEGIVDDDVFAINQDDPSVPPVFDFPRDRDTVTQFNQWLQRQERDGVLEIIGEDDNTWVRSAYSRGISDADRRLQQEGIDIRDDDVVAALQTPVHRDQLQDLYARNFAALEGITDEMNRQIREELATGLAEGAGPAVVAAAITDRVDKIGRRRATIMARTEIINSYTTATLNRYEEMGVDTVTVKAEFATAGDERVCATCASLEGNVYTIQQMRTETFTFDENEFPVRPPIHAQCRCTLLPVTDPDEVRRNARKRFEEDPTADNARALLASDLSDEEVLDAFQTHDPGWLSPRNGFLFEDVVDGTTVSRSGRSVPVVGKQAAIANELEDEFVEEFGRDAFNQVMDVGRGWSLAADSNRTGPLWKAVADDTGNMKLAISDRFVEQADDEVVENIRNYIAMHQEKVREVYGDEIPVYRGIPAHLAEEGAETSIEHRAVESWSTDPAIADWFGRMNSDGIVVMDTATPDEVAWTSHFDDLVDNESEFVRIHEGVKRYSEDQIVSTDDDQRGIRILRHFVNTYEEKDG